MLAGRQRVIEETRAFPLTRMGRHYVLPDDLKELAMPVLAHRMLLDAEAEFAGATVANVLSRVLSSVEPPSERAA